MTLIPRIVEESQENIVSKMVTMILGLPRPETAAITVFPGRGENERLQYAMKIWERQEKSYFLLVAGCEWELEKTQPQPTIRLLREKTYGLVPWKVGVNIQYHAHCTPDQTGWVAQKVWDLGIKSIGLVVTPYHLPRAYLTLLKEVFKGKMPRIPIIPLPAPKDPGAIVPEDNVDAWTLFDGEAKRILDYQKKGDVATLPELKKYLTWLWQQPLLQI